MKSFKFIPSQYEKGVSLREDIYNNQFSIIFSQQLGVHAVEKNIKRKFKSINDAIIFIEKFINRKESNNSKFKAKIVSIIDRHQQKVITGEVNHFNKFIGWFCPVSNHELNRLLDDQSSLYEQANYEYFYDDSRYAGDSLTEQGNRLNNFISSHLYKNCSELTTLKFKFYYPNILV
ncbi:hypothetical protein [Orbus mooreae]|uniref:hypothetical protein n=1 Tax=Orbus mooreae TaxID=3074107 RepID=UPI00370D1E77